MANKATIFLVLAAALLLSMYGCVYVGDPSNNGQIADADKLGTTTSSLPQYNNQADMICEGLNVSDPCYLMVCKNSSWLIDMSWLSSWFDTTLVDGKCSFEAVNSSSFQDLLLNKEDNSTIRSFMVGFGPSFTSTDKANQYCNYSLQIATKWMKGGAGAPPAVPNTDRAKCWLDRNTLPVYIYYTNGMAIDSVQTGKIAKAFDDAGVGPAIITTEIDFNSSDPIAVQNVTRQISAIHDNCEQCLTVLAVKSNDTHALKEILGDPGCYLTNPISCTPEYGMVDIVGFGFLANEYPTCSLDTIIGANVDFSRTILQNYSKPSIWLYAGASEGNNSDGSCFWSNQSVHNFYNNIFSTTPYFPSAGVIGVSFYEATDGSGPLNCSAGAGCDYGIFHANGSQKHPEINSWADYCKKFGVNQSFRSPLLFSRNGRGSVCETRASDDISKLIETSLNSPQALSYGNLTPQVVSNVKLSCGEVCPSDSEMPSPEIYDDATRTDGTDYVFPSNHCKIYPTIDEKADAADISAIYMRATFEEESGFDRLAVSCSNTSQCGNPQKYNASKICVMSGRDADCAHISGDPNTHECPSGWWPCAYGIAQCIELPNSTTYNTKCGGTEQFYDPFDPAKSACCGIDKFSQNLMGPGPNARKFLNDNWEELRDGGTCNGGITEDERLWAEYFLASTYYGIGAGNTPTMSNFTTQRDLNGQCTGHTHYIEYLRSLPANNMDYGYAAVPMSMYISAVGACASDCPGKE